MSTPALAKVLTIRAKYEFTEDEKKGLGSDLAEKNIAKRQLEDERRSNMSDFKDREDRMKSDISRLSNNISTGYEYREYRVTVKKDYIRKIKKFIEVGTNKVVDTKEFEPEDYQYTMDDIKKPAAEKKPKAVYKDVSGDLRQGVDIKPQKKKGGKEGDGYAKTKEVQKEKKRGELSEPARNQDSARDH